MGNECTPRVPEQLYQPLLQQPDSAAFVVWRAAPAAAAAMAAHERASPLLRTYFFLLGETEIFVEQAHDAGT